MINIVDVPMNNEHNNVNDDATLYDDLNRMDSIEAQDNTYYDGDNIDSK
jgi:hypothetical protein